MTYRVSPGVYPFIIDDSINAQFVNNSIGAIVGGSDRGPLGPTHVTSYKRRVQLYGVNNPATGHFIDSADAFLMESTELWMNRVVAADGKYGLGLISNNTLASLPAGTSFTSIPAGSDVPYNELNREVVDIELSGAFQVGNSMQVHINGSDSAVVTFNTDHNTTMTAVQQATQNLLDGIAAGGLAWLVPMSPNHLILRIISPQAISLVVTATVNGTSHPTATVYDADWLTFVVSENPGAWCNHTDTTPGVAAGITSVDRGIPQRVTLSLSAALITGNSLNVTINNQLVTVPFNTDSNTTLSDFAAAYIVAFPGAAASVVNANNGINGNRQVVLVGPDAATPLVITTANVTGGVSQAVVTYSTTLNRIPSSNSFVFSVYENNNFVTPDELFYSTYLDGIDGLGNPTGFEYVVNEGPKKSPRVRVVVNPLFSGTVNDVTHVTNSTYERYLTGGQKGSLVTTQQVVNGWDDFANPDKITVRILINGGYATPEVHQKMVNLASHRMDCIAVLDTPSDKQSAQDAVDYRNNVMNVDSFWGAVYTPDVLIYDSNIGRRRYIPPSGLVAAQYAYTDKTAAAWFAPAGLTRGMIRQALNLRVTYDEGDRDLLSGSQVNAIRKYGSGFPIWGEFTLQKANSALSSVPVVRLIIIIVTESVNVTAYSVFEPNNPFTWHRIRTRENEILGPIKTEGGLNDFYVQCDDTNNTPDVIDQRVCKVALWIKPALSILFIKLDVVVTRQSATFSVEMAAANNQY